MGGKLPGESSIDSLIKIDILTNIGIINKNNDINVQHQYFSIYHIALDIIHKQTI